MIKKPTQKEWGCKLLLCKEVVDNLEQHFEKLEVPYMPINGAYFCHTDQFDTIPPSRLFEVDFIVEEENFEKVIDSLEDLNNCKKVVNNNDKTIFSYTIGEFDIRVDIYRKINCPGNSEIRVEHLFMRGFKNGTSCIVHPTKEDAMVLLFCKTFQNISLFFDEALFTKIFLIYSGSEFSWEKFWGFAREYTVEKFAAYLLLVYEKHQKVKFLLPRRNRYSRILSFKVVQRAYIITPQLIRKLLFKLPFVENPVTYLVIKAWNIPKRKLVNSIRSVYRRVVEWIAKPLIISAENAAFRSLSFSACENAREYKLPDIFKEQFIISTTNGLWLLKNDTMKQMTVGMSYGITRIGRRWYASQIVGRYSRIISFRLDATEIQPKMRDFQVEHSGLSINIHQIDSFDNELYITDTLKNRILYVNGEGKKKWIYPNRYMKSRYPYAENNHFNSIFIHEDSMYILAHNGWHKQKQKSQIFVLDRSDFKNSEIIETDAQDAHNIVFFKNDLVFCDSKGGTLMWGNAPVFTDKEHFLRGLSLTKDMVAVGGSQIVERNKRAFSDSIIWFLDYKFNVKKSIELKKIGQINEIRAVDFDYGLSESWKNEQ